MEINVCVHVTGGIELGISPELAGILKVKAGVPPVINLDPEAVKLAEQITAGDFAVAAEGHHEADPKPEPAPKKKPAKAAKQAPAAKEPEPEPEPAVETVIPEVVEPAPVRQISRDELKAFCSNRKAKDRINITKILKEVGGVERFAQLPESKFAEVYKAVQDAQPEEA